MEMEYLIEQIKQEGFWSFIEKHPINPITIVASLIIIGVIILIVNAKVKKRRASQYLARNPDSAVISMTVDAQKKGHYSLEYYIPENRYIFEPFTLP